MQIPQNVFSLLGLDSLPDDRKQAMLDKMTELVQKRLTLRLLESLADADARTFEQMLHSRDLEDPAIADFLRSKVPNIQDMLTEEILGLKTELTQSVSM